MANALTGDFDVVAQFSTGAINRILAAMHRSERFPHSLTLRVDDTLGPRPNWPSVVGSVDVFGDPTVNPDRIRPHGELTGVSIAGGRCSVRDSIVNADLAGVNVEPIVPSDLQGRAQLQLSPPSIDVTDGSGSRVTVRMDVRARYLPDPNTPRLAEFVRGTLQITAPISQMGSEAAHVIDIDFKSSAVAIVFTSAWSSRPLSAEDLSAIHLLIGNALKTSFLPSNAVVPPRIHHLLFKTFTGNIPAVAVLLNVRQESGLGNAGTVNTPFLNAQDHFAFAAGADLVQATFGPTLESILTQPIPPIPVAWTSYSVQLNGACIVARTTGPDRYDVPRGCENLLLAFEFRLHRQTGPQAVRGRRDRRLRGRRSDAAPLERHRRLDCIAVQGRRAQPDRENSRRCDQERRSSRQGSTAPQRRRQSRWFSERPLCLLDEHSGRPARHRAARVHRGGRSAGGDHPARLARRRLLAAATCRVRHHPCTRQWSGRICRRRAGSHSAENVDSRKDPSANNERYRPGPGAHFIDTDRFVLLHREPGFSDGVAMRVLPGYASLCLTIEGAR